MKKKLVSALLISTMAVSAFVGCGEAAETTTEQPAAATEEAAPEAAATDADPIANLIAATEGTVDLTVWCSELESWQKVVGELTEEFKAQYPDVDFNITIGSESEANCKDDVLADPEVAADVFVFADDQLNELVQAGALQSLDATFTYDVNSAYAANTLDAAKYDGKLYAYPITASNGYFLYYDKSVFTDADVESWEALVAAAEAADVNVGMEFSGAWYLYGFFAGAGCDLGLLDDGVNNACDWNSATGLAVAESVSSICSSKAVLNLTNSEATEQAKAGTLKAFVDGTWDAEAFQEAYGDGYAAVKLPTFDVNGTATQMGSYVGYKFVGVNSYSKNAAWAMLLAEHLTNEASQVKIGDATLEGMANAAAGAQQSSPELAAVAAQSQYGDLQRVGGNYWSPAATLGQAIYDGSADLQAALDEAVEGITAPVE